MPSFSDWLLVSSIARSLTATGLIHDCLAEPLLILSLLLSGSRSRVHLTITHCLISSSCPSPIPLILSRIVHCLIGSAFDNSPGKGWTDPRQRFQFRFRGVVQVNKAKILTGLLLIDLGRSSSTGPGPHGSGQEPVSSLRGHARSRSRRMSPALTPLGKSLLGKLMWVPSSVNSTAISFWRPSKRSMLKRRFKVGTPGWAEYRRQVLELALGFGHEAARNPAPAWSRIIES